MGKLCLFGDSISKGVVIDALRERYTVTKNCFANILSSGSIDLELTNFSMLGCTVGKGQSMINRHIRAVEASELLVLEYGGNDSDHNWKEIAADPAGEHLPKTPVAEFGRTYRSIIDKLNTMGKRIAMLNLPPIDERKYFDWFSRGLDRTRILRWLGGNVTYIYRFHELYNVAVCNIAAERGVPLIDIRTAFLEKRNYSDFLCDDGIHPDEKGHRLIAEAIARAMPGLETRIFGELTAADPALST
jgi:lysophospholipase L1-like esterase